MFRDRIYPKPSRRPGKNNERHQRKTRLHFTPRKRLNVGALVSSEPRPARPNLRLGIVGILFIGLLAVMVLRLWSLQVIQQKSSAAAVTANQVRIVTIPAPRGEIVDRTGRVLVEDQLDQEIVLSRNEALAHPSIIGKVATLLGETAAQVNQALNDPQYSPYQPVPIALNVPMAAVQFLETHRSEFPGVSVQDITQRSYPAYGNVPSGALAPDVLGYVGPISASELAHNPGQGYNQTSQYGKTGLENEYQQYLRGTDGIEELSVNAQGKVVGVLKKRNPVEGDTLVTNIDAGLQVDVQNALQQVIMADRQTRDPTNGVLPAATNGAAVVMNARTGAVLALASYPSYNLNEWIGGISTANYAQLTNQCNNGDGCPLDDYAIQGLYTPGSTFKLASATAALQDGVITPSTEVDDTGLYVVPGCNSALSQCDFHDAEAAGAGYVNVTEALTISDDYFFYNIGYLFSLPQNISRFGQNAIQNVANAYGLGEPTGIDLPGEVSGRVDSQALREQLHKEAPKAFPYTTWYTGDNLEMAFGQGETVITPIELADAYATFANGGTRYEPQVANAIVNPVTGKVIRQFTPKVTGHVNLPPSIYQPMLQGFQGVVDNGGTAAGTFATYAGFSYNQYPIAGKTGTADISKVVTNGYQEPNAWFVGFGPLNAPPGSPEYVVVVAVDHAGYGAQAAAPAVINIFNYLYTNPIGPVQIPTLTHPPNTRPLKSNPPAGSPAPASPANGG